MPIASISAAIVSVKSAITVGKAIYDSTGAIEKAELRLKLFEVLTSLGDTQLSLLTANDEIASRDERIRELETALEDKATVIRKHDAYYRMDPSGNATGVPYCPKCWENTHRLRGLTVNAVKRQIHDCQTCKSMYSHDGTQTL
jgi:hypothetical protein